jgi:undecaprenyl-diphosphatase
LLGGKLNDYLVSGILGIVEGLTEFLPVSSTAHLRISEVLLHISLGDGYWKMYTIVIQLGAILCLPVYFRQRIRKFLSTFPAGEKGDRTALTHPLGLTAVAFVVTAIPAFLMTKIIGQHLESLTIMGSSLVVGGIIMWIVDARSARSEAAGPGGPPGRIHTWTMEAMSLGQAIWIGACQILSAVFPGTSRSMSTIAAGQLAGMSRASALEFSFFLSIPTMVAATGYDLLKSVMGKGQNPIGVAQIDAHGWIVLAIGFVHRGLRFGGLVHGLGTEARVCAVCDLPPDRRNPSADIPGPGGSLAPSIRAKPGLLRRPPIAGRTTARAGS